MKKFIVISMLLGALLWVGCDRDRDVECDVDSFVMHCEGQDVVTCAVQPRSKRGHVMITDQYVVNDIVYSCDSEGNLVISNECGSDDVLSGVDAKTGCGYYGTVSCQSGEASENVNADCNDAYADYPVVKKAAKCDGNDLVISSGDGSVVVNHNAMCDPDKGVVVTCKNGQFVESSSVCRDGGAFACRFEEGGYDLVELACDVNQQCVDYVRNGVRTASCFNNDAISSNCGDTKVFGKCDSNNALIFCSNDDGSGKLLRVDCTADGKKMNVNKVCGLVEDNYGYDCQITCQDDEGNNYTDFGSCDDNNVLHYCDQTGKYAKPEMCADKCGWVDHYFDCMDD